MTAYTKSTNFATKDTLTSGDPFKIVKGTEINTEFDNIATAVNSKIDTASPTFTGTVTIPILSVTGVSTLTGVATLTAQPIISSLTASSAVATDASKGLVSVTNTGTGNNVLATSPTLVTPALGTPTSGVLTNCTGLPQAGLATGVAGTGPAFFVGGATTTCASGVTTLITNGTETFDTGGCYNNTGSTVTLNGISAPAYSFAPNVAGYYQFTAVVFINGSATDRPSIHIYKNGSNIIQTLMVGTAILGGQSYQITGLISLNGTSDYVQCYYTQASGSSLPTNSGLTYFCGSLMRAA